MSLDRYDRQRRIVGWNQEKLENLRVAIVGSGNLATYLALNFSGLGIGDVELVDNSVVAEENGFLLFKSKKGDSKVRSLEKILSDVNPLVSFRGIHWRIIDAETAKILSDRDIIIDATNDPRSKLAVLEYSKGRLKNAVTSAAGAFSGEYRFVGDGLFGAFHLQPMYSQSQQGIIPSGVMAGLIAQHVRERVMLLPGEQIASQEPVVYNLLSKTRIGYDSHLDFPVYDLKDKHVVIVGAGALGNVASLALTLLGTGKITLADDDIVEESNLSRQYLFWGMVGRKKSEALAERLSLISPNTECVALCYRVEQGFSDYLLEHGVDLIMDCVDNFRTKATLDELSKRTSIPLVSGGTNPSAGQVVVYKKGQTNCLDCQVQVRRLAAEQIERERSQSCIYQPDPSVVMSNQIIGNLMVGEALPILTGNLKGPLNGLFKYDSASPRKLGVIFSESICRCGD